MSISRRRLLQSGAVAGAASLLPGMLSEAEAAQRGGQSSGQGEGRCLRRLTGLSRWATR